MLDESEHSGAPDIITIHAHAADLGGEIRKHTEKSWRNTSLGATWPRWPSATSSPTKGTPMRIPVELTACAGCD